jgi:hypothetical protein
MSFFGVSSVFFARLLMVSSIIAATALGVDAALEYSDYRSSFPNNDSIYVKFSLNLVSVMLGVILSRAVIDYFGA